MDLVLSEEHTMLKQTVAEFAQAEIKPKAAEYDRSRQFPFENVEKCAKLGLTGITVPEKYGGAGMDSLSSCIVIEEISRVCASTGVILSVNNSLVCDPIVKYGTEELKQRFLPPLASGEKVGTFCLTEPNAGSDAASIRTTARRDGDSYVLNGNKVFATNGEGAGTALVFAVTAKEKKHHGISAFLIGMDQPGIARGKREEKLGITCSGSVEIVLDNCRIPLNQRLGKEDEGFQIAMTTLDGGRIGIAAQAVGIAQGALDESLQYAKERKQFRRSIAEFQAIQFKLANMATETDAARLVTYKAACTRDSGSRFSQESAIAKLFAADVAMKVTREAVQIHGGYGYIKEYPVERYYRDAKITEIYEGTSEVQKIVIARSLLAD